MGDDLVTAAEIARQLRGRKSGAGWSALCPAHDDKTPSVRVREVDGKVLVHCHAGCEQRAVIDALKARGLWPERESGQGGTIVATYDYTDATGNLLYQVVRYEPKDFKQRRPDGAGGWVWRKAASPVLYPLPQGLEAPILFVGEREPAAESLPSHGLLAPTNARGRQAPVVAPIHTSL